MLLSIVVPTFAGADLLARHLPAARAEAVELAGGAELVVVDDGSPEGGKAIAAAVAALGAPVRLVRRPENGGFAEAVNDGLAAARGELVLLLNDDMRLEPGCVAALVAALAARPGLFAVVPVILNLAEGFVESTTALRLHHGVLDVVLPGRAGGAPAQPGSMREVAFACGGALLCRRSDLAELGGFAPLLSPFYWEDVDLSLRARRGGRGIAECGDARVLHEHARTIGRMPPARVRRVYERNRLLVTWVHLAGPGAWARHLAWLLPRVLAAVARGDAAATALPLALARLRTVRAARRDLRPTRTAAAVLMGGIVAAGASGWPPAA